MFSLSKLLPRVNFNLVRRCTFHKSCLKFEKLSGATHKVNNLEKKILIWTGKFKKVEDIPSYMSPDVIERARSKMRIRVANIMMALTLVACLVISINGSRARERGESLQQRTIDHHKKLKEEAAQEKIKSSG